MDSTSDSSGGNATDPMIGRVIASRYRLEKKLGAGAMGSVYRARHVKVGRAFAIKILHVDLLEDSKLQRRFVREAELAGTLSHPNIVTVTDVGETFEGLHYIAMEYAEGPTLGEVIARDAPLPAPRIIDLVSQILDGLQHAHKHGLIHRDFKPDNVIITTDHDSKESPRIVDFGIAIVRDDATSEQRERLTTAGITLGTPHYMAPEHVTGQAIDHRIDLFALGVVLYEMAAGVMPFDGDGVDVARANLLEETPPMSVRAPAVDVDPLIEALARKLMSKSPDARPATAKDARTILDLIKRDRAGAAALLGVTLDDEPLPSQQRPQPAAPQPAVPRYAQHTPPTPYLAVPEPLTYSPSGQDAIVPSDARARPTSPSGPYRARSARVSQPPLPRTTDQSQPHPRAATQPGSQPRAATQPGSHPRAATQPGSQPRAATQPGSQPRAATQPGSQPHAASQPGSQPHAASRPGPPSVPDQVPVTPAPRRARTGSVQRAAMKRRRIWIMLAAALAALVLGGLLAVLLR